MTTLTHPILIDPATGEPLEALGFRANGAPIWPMIGGADDVGISSMPDDDDNEGGDNTPDPDDDDSDDEPKPKPAAKKAPAKKADDSDDENDDEDEDEDLDKPLSRRDARKLRREAQNLRKRASLTAEEREELETLRNEKLSEKEKLEKRATKGESTVAELTAQLEEARLRSALGLPEPDDDEEDDPFLDIQIKGNTYEEKLATARRVAKRFKIGRYAETDSQGESKGSTRKTPPASNLRGQRRQDDDPEDNPIKLADRTKQKSYFSL